VTQQLNRRSAASASYSFDRVWFPGSVGGATSHRTELRFDRGLDRNLNLRLRYRLLRAKTDVRRGTTQEVEAGVAYTPRRMPDTTLFAALAPTLTTQRDTVAQPAVSAAGAFTMGGIVGVEHRFAGSWDAALGYRRSVYYLRGTAEAVGANTVEGAVRGQPGGMVEVSLTLSASLGRPTLTDAAARLSSVGAVGAARVQLSSRVFVMPSQPGRRSAGPDCRSELSLHPVGSEPRIVRDVPRDDPGRGDGPGLNP
jgi:hypothetical protein